MNLAPIVLFTYNRLWHTIQTVEALKKNELADQSDLFIFSDGPKNEEDEEKVKQVREYLRTIKGFKRITIIERDRNFGLANNIIDGVTRIVNEYGKIIVLEDDLITSPYFLKFMNEALEKYKDEEKVMHISGYMYPIRKGGLPNVFFLKPTSCWGWATWKRAWQFFERNPEKQIKALNKKQIKDFNLNHAYNYWEQVRLNYDGKIKTWAIFWYLSMYLKDGLSLHPRDSLVQNIGHDASGIHCGKSEYFKVEFSRKDKWDFPNEIKEHFLARKSLEEFFNKIKPPLWRRVLSRVVPREVKDLVKKYSKSGGH